MFAAGPGLAIDDCTRLTIQVDLARPRLAVGKIESVGGNLAPSERPYLAQTASRVLEQADDVCLCRPLRAFGNQPVQFGKQAMRFVPGEEAIEPALRVPA